jgi:hypothetical protein
MEPNLDGTAKIKAGRLVRREADKERRTMRRAESPDVALSSSD